MADMVIGMQTWGHPDCNNQSRTIAKIRSYHLQKISRRIHMLENFGTDRIRRPSLKRFKLGGRSKRSATKNLASGAFFLEIATPLSLISNPTKSAVGKMLRSFTTRSPCPLPMSRIRSELDVRCFEKKPHNKRMAHLLRGVQASSLGETIPMIIPIVMFRHTTLKSSSLCVLQEQNAPTIARKIHSTDKFVTKDDRYTSRSHRCIREQLEYNQIDRNSPDRSSRGHPRMVPARRVARTGRPRSLIATTSSPRLFDQAIIASRLMNWSK